MLRTASTDAKVAATGLDSANALDPIYGSAAIVGRSDSVATLKWETDAFASFSLGKADFDETTFRGLDVSSAFSADRTGLPATVSSIEPSP
jgi:hypothetical protein